MTSSGGENDSDNDDYEYAYSSGEEDDDDGDEDMNSNFAIADDDQMDTSNSKLMTDSNKKLSSYNKDNPNAAPMNVSYRGMIGEHHCLFFSDLVAMCKLMDHSCQSRVISYSCSVLFQKRLHAPKIM
jgi:hypothetical protein